MLSSNPFRAAVVALFLVAPTGVALAVEPRFEEEHTSCSEANSFTTESGEDADHMWWKSASSSEKTCESTDSDAGATVTAGEEQASFDLGSRENSHESDGNAYDLNASRRNCGWPQPPCPYTYRGSGSHESRNRTTRGAYADSAVTGSVTIATAKCESFDNAETSSGSGRDESGRVTSWSEGEQELGSSCANGVFVEGPTAASLTKDVCGAYGDSAFESRDASSSTSRTSTQFCFEGVMGSAQVDGTGTGADGTGASGTAGRRTWTHETCKGSFYGGETCTHESGDAFVLEFALFAGGTRLGGGSSAFTTPAPLADFLDHRYDHLP